MASPGGTSGSEAGFASGALVADRYRIEGTLGRGGYGTVVRASRLADGLPVAVKLLHAHHLTGGVEQERFEREAAILQRIAHPNVVRRPMRRSCSRRSSR